MANKKKSISLKEKQQIIESIEKGEKQASVGQRLGLTKSTVNTIWKNKETLKRQFETSHYNSDSKRFRTANHKDIDEALLLWFKQARSENITVNRPLLLAKTNSLAKDLGHDDFIATTGFTLVSKYLA